MLNSFGNPELTPVAVAALLFLVVVLAQPWNPRAPLRLAFQQVPLLRAGLAGALVTALLGTVVNDSGVSILALGLTVTVPITLAVCAHALQSRTAAPGAHPVFMDGAFSAPQVQSVRSAGPS
jgi:hypothetical protein